MSSAMALLVVAVCSSDQRGPWLDQFWLRRIVRMPCATVIVVSPETLHATYMHLYCMQSSPQEERSGDLGDDLVVAVSSSD